MDKLPSLTLVSFLLLVLLVPAASLSAQNPFDGCDLGVFTETGAEWAICMPDRIQGLTWNGDLIIYAHGYVPDLGQPPSIPVDQYVLPDGTAFPDLANQLGYAFATTSFRTNGLAVKDGVADVMDLLGEFKEQHPLMRPSHVYLFGASEGGLITAKAIEQHKAQFDGGIAACGPIGDFRMQVDYVGDMRVVFDAFFPGTLPPTAIEIPESLMLGWETVYAPAVALALSQDPASTGQLLNVTQAPIDPGDPATAPETVLGVLWYNVYGTNDAYAKMGGNPYDNADHTYVGSGNDILLNQAVSRYQADRNALASIEAHYQTTGRLKTPLVTLHNILDPVVPYEHALLYGDKVIDAGASGLYTHIPAAEPYGHCNFSTAEIVDALNALLDLVQKSGN